VVRRAEMRNRFADLKKAEGEFRLPRITNIREEERWNGRSAQSLKHPLDDAMGLPQAKSWM